MARRWYFEQDSRKEWRWKRLETEAQSTRAFPTAAACMLDAVKFAVERRRAEAQFARKSRLQ